MDYGGRAHGGTEIIDGCTEKEKNSVSGESETCVPIGQIDTF
jgi:hypothetical protein